jgi:hypothetical protein
MMIFPPAETARGFFIVMKKKRWAITAERFPIKRKYFCLNNGSL